ncbi:TolC family protein [Dinghuibacter silviterrae]|uniref:Outer membrane protein TolC n=1 Tax=Dinghuibacter silviterrae TaxID=1539049 RepID=A0A4R8DN00_9BACT|nr:TolC family protein [Dinghuibacter silviterrae]TDW99389.1 outer membrane protein TolC [Dinghuibacter silviterrae]
MKQTIVALAFLLLALPGVRAQSPRSITLEEAVKLGIDNSKQLRQSKNKIDEALARLDQAKDLRLPSAKVSFQYLHALMLARTLNFPGLTQPGKPLSLSFDFPAYLGTLAISEPIFNGNQFKYARQSADLLLQLSKLDADKDKDDVTYLVISAYINYNKILQNQLIVGRNMQDVDQKLTEITKYESQGLATRNDVLRFQLQKSQIELSEIELENDRKDANYDLNIILGLPDSTQLTVSNFDYKLQEQPVFTDLLTQADANRRELQELAFQDKVADINIKKIQDGKLPTLAATAGMYYINPTGKPIPTDHTVLAPITLGVGVSWNIGSLYTTKNKVAEAAAQKQEIVTSKDQAQDDIRKDVHKAYLGYLQSLDKIRVLQVAVDQAEENERITESKFQNNLANTTDRIDAQTQLYQSRVNLELAKSDAAIAYYTMIKSTGNIHL